MEQSLELEQKTLQEICSHSRKAEKERGVKEIYINNLNRNWWKIILPAKIKDNHQQFFASLDGSAIPLEPAYQARIYPSYTDVQDPYLSKSGGMTG